jgi:hypothetical protein
MTGTSTTTETAATFGGFIDALGGITAIVLAVIALSGVQPTLLLAIGVIVFGAALMIQGGAMVSEYAHFMSPIGGIVTTHFDTSGLSAVFLSGAAGIVLGVLALLGIFSAELSAIAMIVYGGALVVSSSAVVNLQAMRSNSLRASTRSGAEVLAADMASGSAGVQTLTGLAAIVLGILAVAGINMIVLSLVALIALGATLVMTGGTLSGTVMGFMRSSEPASLP